MAETHFHARYLALVEEIERTFPVTQWSSSDVDIWPLARMDLYLDLYWANTGGAPAVPHGFARRVLAHLATPLTNAWKSRRDMTHWVVRPSAAHAIVLGDGVSLDCIDGVWQDRFCEPLIAALENRGLSTFVMQCGDLSRLPWLRPTYAANLVSLRGLLRGYSSAPAAALPAHEEVIRFLACNGITAPSLSRAKLARRALVVSATASAFERVLRVVRPRLAFVVCHYAGLGPAFVLACRRRGILSVDVQHCAQDGAHKAYGWWALPERGYRTLPAMFWNWTEKDAADIRAWARKLPAPWHRSVHGGNTQIASFLEQDGHVARAWDLKFGAASGGGCFEREILVALQPVNGQRDLWVSLRAQIEAAPAGWRWWIRRHPASREHQDIEYASLLSLQMPNVLYEPASGLPLPALLRHMSVVLSLTSAAAAEAAVFGVPSFFLCEAARGIFADLLEQGHARIIDVSCVIQEIAGLCAAPTRPLHPRQPDVGDTLAQLEETAGDYAQLCFAAASNG